MKFFNRFKVLTAASRVLEEQLYETVAKELREGVRRDGLWVKALAKCGGDNAKAKALYTAFFKTVVA